MSLAEARTKARIEAGKLAAGIDVRQARREEDEKRRVQRLNTFELLARAWHAQAKKDRQWSAGYAQKVLRHLEVHVFPWLGDLPMPTILPTEAVRCLHRIKDCGTLETALRVREAMIHVFQYAVDVGALEPAANFMNSRTGGLPPPRSRHYAAITDAGQLAQLLRDIQAYNGNILTRMALRLMPLLFQRPGQLRLSHWEDFDLDAAIWRCPPEKMKLREWQKRDARTPAHLVPLPRQAVAILRDMLPLTGPALEQQWSIPMSNYARSAVYTASQALAAQGLTVMRSHLTEVVAALLSYRTHAALAVDEADTTREYHLDDAEVYVLNVPLGTGRAVELGLQNGPVVVQACTAALKAGGGQVGVYESVADFYDSHAREALAQAISDSDDVAGAMAESNASFPYEPEMEDACPAPSDLWAARDEWTIEAAGDLTGEYDPEGDRMFNGDTLNCRGWLTYRKAGRAGLVFGEAGGPGGADDSWRDRDYEDELAYRQSLEKGQAAG